MIVGFPGAYPPNEGTCAASLARLYASQIELEITPEPSGDERSAIVAALAEEDAPAAKGAQTAWRRAGIEDDAAPDAGYERDSTL